MAAQSLIRKHVSEFSKAQTAKKPISPSLFRVCYFGGSRGGDWRDLLVKGWAGTRFDNFWADDVKKKQEQLYYIDLIGGAEKLSQNEKPEKK